MRWFEPYLNGRVIEYGAGIGTLSAHLRPLVRHLTLVEPSGNLIPGLASKFSSDTSVEIIARSLEEHAEDQPSDTAEAVILVNVLEHIKDDVWALQQLSRIVVKGGHLLIFVPALGLLMSDLDRKIGHYRRYQRPELRSKMSAAGFEILHCRYFDFPGVLPWLVINRWLGATSFNPKLAWLYDRAVVPVARAAETLVAPPFGKNLIAVGQLR